VLILEAVIVLILALATMAAWRVAVRARAVATAHAAEHETYRAVLTQLPDAAVMIFDADLRFTRVKGEALAAHGWSRDELVGRTILEIVGTDRVAPMAATMRAALAGESGAFEWPAVRGGAVYRVEVAPLRDASGAVDRGLMVIRDITQQHDLGVELERSRGFLAAALEQLVEPVIVVDGDGRVQVVNAAARRTYDVDPEVAVEPLDWIARFNLGGDGSDLTSLERLPLFRALQGETIRGEVLSATMADGTLARLQVTAGPVIGHDGQRLGAVMATNDVTERNATEEALRAGEQRYRSIVQGLRDVVFQMDLAGNWTFLNDAWERHTGHAVAESLGRPSWERIHPDDRVAHAGSFNALVEGREDDHRGTYRFVTPGGEVRWVDVRAHLLRGHSGRPAGITGVIEDVTVGMRAHQYEDAERAVLAHMAVATTPEEGMPGVLEALGRQLEWDAAELWIRDGDHLRREYAWQGALATDEDGVDDLRLEVGEGLPGQAWAVRRPLWVSDVKNGPPCPRGALAAADGLCSGVAFPLLQGRAVEGLILLLGRDERPEEPQVHRPLQAIGAHIAHFLVRCRAESRIAEHASDLAALSRVAHELAAQTDLPAVRASVCEAAVGVSGAAFALLLEPEGDHVRCAASAGALPGGQPLPLYGNSPAALAVLEDGEPRFVADVLAEPSVSSPWIESTGTRAAYWQPLVYEDAIVGVLAIGWTHPRPEVPDRERELLRQLSADGSLAVGRAQLLARLAS
jgi:PAS domain S-box-containing protein